MMLEEKYIEKIRSKISKSSKIKIDLCMIIDALLSAGLSTRMGQPKALLNWHGKKRIFHIDVLNDIGIRNINLVLGHDKEKIIEVVNRKKSK